MLVILLTGSLNLTVNIEAQRAIWFILPLLPVFIIFFIGSVAETNRAPFDLAEAESELVSGFMTEHAAVIFVFFFLAEYASILLICILNAILFIGGYLLDHSLVVYMLRCSLYGIAYIFMLQPEPTIFMMESWAFNSFSSPILEGLIYGLTIGIKSSIMVFIFIWVRASFPRIRFDQLMSFSWTILLPVVIAFIILLPCIIYSFEVISSNAYLF